MNAQLKRLYDEIELERTSGDVYRSTFFDIIGPALIANPDKSVTIRRTLGLKAFLEQCDLKIRDDELLLGTLSGCYPKVNLPDYEVRKAEAYEVINKYLNDKPISGKGADTGRKLIYARNSFFGNINFLDLQKIINELAEEFSEKGLTRLEVARELEQYFVFDFGENARVVSELPWGATNHNDLNPPKIVCMGLNGMRDEVLKYQAGCAAEKEDFYESALMTIDIVIDFFKRYAAVARDAATTPGVSDERKKELIEMADITEKVSREKPETFREALQLLWLMYWIGNVSCPVGSCNSFARFDQYMYPFYKADIDSGRITEDEALLYIGNLFCKINEPKMRSVITVVIGGQTPQGDDAANDLTRLCLLATQMLKQPYPNLTVRFFEKSPKWLYELVAETARMDIGNPMILNDDVYIPNLVKLGIPLIDARDYYNMGCVENMIMGRTPIWLGVNQTDFAGTISRTLSGGVMGDSKAYLYEKPLDDEKLLIDIDTLDTFEKFLEAYKEQMRFSLRDTKEKCDLQDKALFANWCDPFGSLVMDGCIAKGVDMYKSGCKLGPMKPVKAVGLGSAADSLSAIKKFVYDEKKLTLRELIDILDVNFEGHENMRAMLSNGTPCYGNDDPTVDAIARDIFKCFCDTVHEVNKQGIFGYAVVSLFSFLGHIQIGEVVGALPNGRLRGETLSDTMNPSQGKDTSGPTRMLKSAINLGNRDNVTGAYSLNIKLNPSSVSGKKGLENFKTLIKAYLKNDGVQLQFNFIDANTLKAAQKEPEKHQNLIVRVAGYSEYFNCLDTHMQDEIISRTMHEAG